MLTGNRGHIISFIVLLIVVLAVLPAFFLASKYKDIVTIQRVRVRMVEVYQAASDHATEMGHWSASVDDLAALGKLLPSPTIHEQWQFRVRSGAVTATSTGLWREGPGIQIVYQPRFNRWTRIEPDGSSSRLDSLGMDRSSS